MLLSNRNNYIYGLFISVFFIGLSSGFASAQGQQCVAIESDLQRLGCFDTAYESSGEPALTATEAVRNLIELITYTSNDEVVTVFQASNNPCFIDVQWKRLINANTPRPEQILYTSRNDLSKVERVGDWQGNRDRWSILLFNERGFNGQWIKYAGKGPDYTNAASIVREELPVAGDYLGRDAAMYLLATEYKADTQKIKEALETAVSACRMQ